MADSNSTVSSASPQLDVQDILREVEQVARECNRYLFGSADSEVPAHEGRAPSCQRDSLSTP